MKINGVNKIKQKQSTAVEKKFPRLILVVINVSIKNFARCQRVQTQQ